MPKLETADGSELTEEEVTKQFAKALSAPEPDEPLAPAPPRADNGRAEGSPEPPESPVDDRPRTRPQSRGTGRPRGRPKGSGKKTAAAPAEGTYVRPVSELLQALTIAGALAPVPKGPLYTRIRLQANLVDAHTAGIATATDLAARNNAIIRKGVESLTLGPGGWVLPAVVALAPFGAQSLALWRGEITPEMTAAAEQFEHGVRAQLADAGAEDASATDPA
jgi:hypothetical protein